MMMFRLRFGLNDEGIATASASAEAVLLGGAHGTLRGMAATFRDPNIKEVRIPPKAAEFAAWFCTPVQEREIKLQREWAEANDVAERTVAGWKMEGWWPDLLKEVSGSEFGFTALHDQMVMDALYRKALGGDMTAVKIYIDQRDLSKKSANAGIDPSAIPDDELNARRKEIQERQGA